ncbi:hypothetical protein HanPI659440_Chr13g0505931 [Helianthus annuus]|nr:hypothetical protein HanPI659440_Chr13g0505931 [Helianthus annuus]
MAQGPEKITSVNEVPVITVPSSSALASKLPKDVQDNPVHVEQGFVIQDEEEKSPIRPGETSGDYYYQTYSEKRASDIHALVWKLKMGDSFTDWQVCREWLQGTFPPAEIKFKEEQTRERIYQAYLQKTASSTSTTHRIVREWRNMHKEWDVVEALKKYIAEEKAKVVELRTQLEADQAKFENEQKTEEWSAMGGKIRPNLKLPSS